MAVTSRILVKKLYELNGKIPSIKLGPNMASSMVSTCPPPTLDDRSPAKLAAAAIDTRLPASVVVSVVTMVWPRSWRDECQPIAADNVCLVDSASLVGKSATDATPAFFNKRSLALRDSINTNYINDTIMSMPHRRERGGVMVVCTTSAVRMM